MAIITSKTLNNLNNNTVVDGGGIWLDIAGNYLDSSNYTLVVSSLNLTGTKGIAALNPAATNGVYYTPGAAFAYLSQGETATDSFTYTISDGHGGTATATDTVTITGVNAPPVAKADTATTTASAPVQINVLANDTDVNRDDTLSVTAITTAHTQGSVALGANGVVTYTPGAAFKYLKAGTTATDSFGYTVSDNHGASSSTTDTVTITGTWLSPTAASETAATTSTQSLTINVLAGDSDPQPGQTLSLTALNLTGTSGKAVLNANGTVTYTPGASALVLAAGATASDSFGYTVADSHGVSSTGTVTVTVTGVHENPIAVADTATTTATQSIWINATGNDTDVQKYSLAVTSLGLTGTKGIVTLNSAATNGVYYTPGAAFAYLKQGETATDSFTYTISDGHGGTATATDTVTITGVNAPPVAVADTATTTATQSVWINATGNDTDVQKYSLAVTSLGLTGTKGDCYPEPGSDQRRLLHAGCGLCLSQTR